MVDARRLAFDGAAQEYDRTRPSYPAELVELLDPPGVTLEVGCGSGQLTKDLVERGHRVTAVDLGRNLVDIARRRLPGVTFVVAPFEDAMLEEDSFDLVASATAFHWVDPDVGYPKAFHLLRSDGRLALLSHRVVAGPLADEFGDVVRRCAPSFPLSANFTAADLRGRMGAADQEDISSMLAAIEGNPTRAVSADRWFCRPEIHATEWEEQLPAEDVLAALVATSVWVDIPPAEQDRLDGGLRDLAWRAGGTIPRRRVTTLLLSRRRRAAYTTGRERG